MSHYQNLPRSEWLAKTRELVENYPLTLDEIREIALLSWSRLWDSEIGGQISLSEVEPPATVVGYFFFKNSLRMSYHTDTHKHGVEKLKSMTKIL